MWKRERTSHPSPWRGVLLLLATVTATELMILNVIFWARAQASLPGLVLAVTWPWIASAAGLLIWEMKSRWAPASRFSHRIPQTRMSVGLGLALTALVLIGRLVIMA
jgi:hypothetical protein